MNDFHTPPPFKVCAECGGEGLFQDGPEVEDCFACKNCHGTGRIPIWYTIPQWEELTGRNVPDDMPVFLYWEFSHKWLLGMYEDVIEEDIQIIVCATEAGRPPKDWRP